MDEEHPPTRGGRKPGDEPVESHEAVRSLSALRPAGLPIPRSTAIHEVWLVLGLSLGRDAVQAAVLFVGALTSGRPLPQQHAVLVGSLTPGRPWIDLMLQLVSLTSALVPVALIVHFLHRSGESLADIGLDRSRIRRDGAVGLVLATLVGGGGLSLYILVHAAGLNLTVVPETLPPVWWRVPVLLLSAAENGVLEEVLVVGYLLHRLRQIGWSDTKALTGSALLRASYHIYQGLGGFIGNAAMGVIFGRTYQRKGRLLPLIVAHTLMDAVVFVGYVLLAGHVSWLPRVGGT